MKDTNSMTVTVLLFIAIFVRGPSSINAVTNPDDASTLNSIYTTLNSPQQLTNWIANGGDPCAQAWKGITCSPDSRVTEIVIPNLGLSGSIGYQLASLTAVTNFDISNNNFGNQIPFSLPPNVQQLNLAGCNFNGALPYSISQMVALNYLNVSHNQIQGNLPDNFASLTNLSTLDYSFNAMSGNLTPSMSSLTGLHNLYLENNQFTGSLDVLANLPLQILNVENNQFSGYIPEPLKSINLKTGGNPLSTGPAPPLPPGTPPAPSRRVNPTPKSNSNNGSSDKSSKSSIGIGAIIGIVLSVLLICAIIAFFILRRRSRKQTSDVEKFEMPPFVQTPKKEAFEVNSVQASSAASVQSYDSPTTVNLKPPPINKSFDDADITSKPIIPNKKINLSSINAKAYSIADLQMATESFNSENLIGEGSIGRVYRGQFDDGKVLAVKKINSFAIASPEDFLEIVSEISKLHHPNVTELNGYCSEYGQHLIVYEFHKNGSLHDFLHLSYEDSTPLIWNSRVKIALGSARALEYLHEVCSPSVVHKNFKSANILLDSELNPHLSDSGLASLVQDADQTGSGYSAPEVAMSGQYTIKSDVYSFGVVMLELLTGRKPFDSSKARSEQSLVRWATPQLHDIDALAKMVDPTLENLYPVKSLSRFADVIALCVQSEPEFRPPMSEVVEALVRLVQRANMSKRTAGNDLSPSLQNSDGQDNLMF